MENMIEIKGLRKSFGSAEVLKGVDLSIRKGEIVVLIGSSGCEKTVDFIRKLKHFDYRIDRRECYLAENVKAQKIPSVQI